MTDFAERLANDRGQAARTLHIVDAAGLDAFLGRLTAPQRALALAAGFAGKAGEMAVLPGAGEDWSAAVGVANVVELGPWCLARAAEALPTGTYRTAIGVGDAALGWLLAQHRFERYRKTEPAAAPRVLLTADPASRDAAVAEAEAVALVRDLVNTPAADMGPAALEAEAQKLAAAHSATLTVTRGDALLTGMPMIHAVGRAAAREHAPRLIEFTWGDPARPRVAIIGKGVCFDTGGLDIKPSSGMRLMKKDMGGAAHALALARLIMTSRLPVCLHLLIPAVENAIGSEAFRPGDVLTSRSGQTVEIANTDAEGRLVLADALTRAGEESPVLIIDFATLTGAARVALGPDLPALFVNDDALADEIMAAAHNVADPMWRLPLHDGYDEMLASDIADMNNAPDGGFAGAITAALFLRKFAPTGVPWAHIDTFAWRPVAKPGRPRGGEALGLRAVWTMLRARFG